MREGRIERPDGRIVAFAQAGPEDGRPVLRLGGTPSSRHSIPPCWEGWEELGLRLISPERPGFGDSTRLPGRGLLEPADDLAAILDSLELDRVSGLGITSGAPHLLAFAARHPDRILAGSIVGGAAPMTGDDLADSIEINRQAHRVVEAGDFDGAMQLIRPFYETLIADPLGAVSDVLEHANESDKHRLAALEWQRRLVRNMQDALVQGPEGWVDESMAFARARWDEIPWEELTAPIAWFHTRGDSTAPYAAAERLVAKLPTVTLHEWPPTEGALYSPERERRLLRDLLDRSLAVAGRYS